jgi:hypothetical protein
MLLKFPSRRKSEVMIVGGLCSDLGATTFSGSYMGIFRSDAFGLRPSASAFPNSCNLSNQASFIPSPTLHRSLVPSHLCLNGVFRKLP